MAETTFRFVSPLERALYLKSVNVLGELSSPELATMAQHTQERFFRKGSVILSQGQPVQSFHVVADGRVAVEGDEHGRAVLGPKQKVLGFLTMLAHYEERHCDVGLRATAETDVTTLEIEADDFYDVLEDHSSMLHYVIKNLARFMLHERREMSSGTYLAPGEGLLKTSDRELDLVERLVFLRRGTALELANMDTLVELARNMEELRFDRGDVLWEPGAPSGFVYIIAGGTVRCNFKAEGHHFRAGPGYPLGNIESLAAEPRWFQAVAESPLVILRGSTDVFLDVVEDHFEMARGFVAAMALGIIRVLSQKNAVSTDKAP